MTRESWHDGTYSHGWGSSAIIGVTQGIMGVHQLSPGFASFSVKPKLGGLTSASITVPCLRGYINVTAGPNGALDVGVPCNTRAILCTPRSSHDLTVLSNETHFLLLDGKVTPAMNSGGHLCLSEPVGCGASGTARVLRTRLR